MADRVVYGSVADLEADVDIEHGPTEWLTVEQERIDRFAEATEDRQWIHVDAGQARNGPYGKTIAHGFLTLSLVPYFLARLRETTNHRMTLNYGLDRVRFTAPVPVDSRLRGTVKVTEVRRLDEASAQVTSRITIHLEGSERPACVVDQIARMYFDS